MWAWDCWGHSAWVSNKCQCQCCGGARPWLLLNFARSSGWTYCSLSCTITIVSHTFLILPSCHFSGASCLLDVGSKPTLEELDKLILGHCSEWEQTALCLGVQSYVLEAEKWDNHENPDEAYRGIHRRWLLHAPGTGGTERTWHSVLKALETSGHSQLAGQLKREHFPFSQPVVSVGESCKLFLSSNEPLWLLLIPSSLLITI